MADGGAVAVEAQLRGAATGVRPAAAKPPKLFEQASATRNDVPGWGHAEAYLALGTQLQAAAMCSARATGSRNP